MEQPIRSFVSQLGRRLLGILFASRWKGGTFHSSNGISCEKPHRIPVTKLQVHSFFPLYNLFSYYRFREKKLADRKYKMQWQKYLYVLCIFSELSLKVQQVLVPVSVDCTCPHCSRIFHRHKGRRHKQAFRTLMS